MMKKTLTILSLLTSLTCFANENAVLNTTPIQDINKSLANSLRCWNNGDLKCFMDALYVKSDKTLFISGTKFIYGWQNSYNHYKEKYGDSKSNMGQLKVTLDEVKLLDNNHAFAYGRYHLQVGSKVYNGVTSLLFLKSTGQWKVMVDHSS